MNLKSKDVKEIIKTLEEGLTDLFQNNRYADFLKTMTNFHGYSLHNTILIALQNPEASLVAGYKKWQSMGRHVKRNEKAITILCPCPHKVKKKVLDKNGNPVLDENGKETLEACILDGQLFCLHSRRYDQGYGGTVHPETGTKINAGICAAGIHPRSCGVSYGRGTLLNLIELKDKVLSWPRRSQPSLKRSPGKVGNESREAEAPASKH